VKADKSPERQDEQHQRQHLQATANHVRAHFTASANEKAALKRRAFILTNGRRIDLTTSTNWEGALAREAMVLANHISALIMFALLIGSNILNENIVIQGQSIFENYFKVIYMYGKGNLISLLIICFYFYAQF
jgi:hypothetical protein